MNDSRKITTQDLIDLMNRDKAKLLKRLPHIEDPETMIRARARIGELTYLLGRCTAHNAGIRQIGPTGD